MSDADEPLKEYASADTIRAAFVRGLDVAATVRARRANLYQLDIPAFCGDGDAVQIYVRAEDDGSVTVTDLGSTRMRVSYHRELGEDVERQLARAASAQGLSVDDGVASSRVELRDLSAAVLGLVQFEAQADRIVASARRKHADAAAFRESVRELLMELFHGRIEAPFFDKALDPDGLYALDAIIRGPHTLAVAAVPGDIEAERAVATKLKMAPSAPPSTRCDHNPARPRATHESDEEAPHVRVHGDWFVVRRGSLEGKEGSRRPRGLMP